MSFTATRVTFTAGTLANPRGRHSFITSKPADEALTGFALPDNEWRDYTAEPVELLVGEGDRIKVQAFGRVRDGVVVKLGRTRLTIRYARNAAGEQHERAFGLPEIAAECWTPITTDDLTTAQADAAALAEEATR